MATLPPGLSEEGTSIAGSETNLDLASRVIIDWLRAPDSRSAIAR